MYCYLNVLCIETNNNIVHKTYNSTERMRTIKTYHVGEQVTLLSILFFLYREKNNKIIIVHIFITSYVWMV
mgnify:FL=1